ncbi:type II toxin-antitoxin system ParD family antitoxin [Prosthecobacter sp.]|uniref:type II toxin-antitoxin system ParD family antitoxin n=1 Tax=Prosthecobacter sp. TaxID=1965333 RepID=UPI003784C4C9
MTQLAVNVPVELGEFIRTSVDAGDFAGPNELVAQALYLFRDQHELDRIKLERLRRDIQVGIDQIERGEAVTDFDVDKFLAEMKSRRKQAQATSM